MQIKALDTELWGYKFRSRLEARWAVFFDRMGIEWQYELQGFMLPSGPYLPDFFLPQWGLWFEVKGKSADEEERQRCKELSYSEFPVLLAEGEIGTKPLTLFALYLDYHSGGESEWPAWIFKSGLFIEERLSDGETKIVNAFWSNLKCEVHESTWKHDLSPWRFSAGAIQAARSARFEHGQAPRRLHGC